ncbi:MAG: membrane integrity-associated transporter subunit PqiC [Proteobacteria bacterium]|nr:membrane integrity-associated transporter subunit PqiC [Pseudomonadota bacterium]
MARPLALLLVLLLAACGSPQTQYFSLQPVSPGDAAAVLAGAAPAKVAPIVIRHVILPATLDRLSMVSVGSQGELVISDRNRWAAPLDGMVQSTLAAELATLLPGEVVMPGDPVAAGQTRVLAVTIRSFAGDPGGRVTLAADWFLLRDGKPIPGLAGSKTIFIRARSGSADAVVPAMSHALFLLSQDIAERVRNAAHARTIMRR